MPTISLIAAMDEASGIGLDNKLLCHLPADLHHFKSTTLGKPIIMGRATFEAIGKPLPGRLNIVLSKTLQHIDGINVFDSLPKALSFVADAPEIMIIGGSQLYTQTIDLATHLYLTHIHHQFNADVFFPKIDKKIWYCSKEEFRKHDATNCYDMTFCTYERA
ncbi:MAG: dihydrofolate reductase [Legionellales bacterium]